MHVKMQRIVKDEAATPVPMVADIVGAASDKFNHFALNLNLEGVKCSKRRWFAQLGVFQQISHTIRFKINLLHPFFPEQGR